MTTATQSAIVRPLGGNLFRSAYSIASKFTWPIVLSRKTAAGKLSCSVGTCVIVNEEGWFLTAFHLMKQFEQLANADTASREAEAQLAAIAATSDLSNSERKRRVNQIRRPAPTDTVRGSGFWGRSEPRVVEWGGIEKIDLALGRLEPFDPLWVSTYPTFKDPNKDFEPGTSLCKLGFPFQSIGVQWDETADKFHLNLNGGLPRFPIEGMLTRLCEVAPAGGGTSFPLWWVETSTPGLKGQSGGPTFDIQGSIWGIQVMTSHLALGFDPPVPNGKPGEKEHQFLNVGLGVHPETIFGLLNERSVKFQVSAY